MKVAIVEDNESASHKLAHLLEKSSETYNIPIQIVYFKDGIEILDNYKSDFDLIYFDVEMPIMDGMTTAKKIRSIDNQVLIVFVTNYVQWAIEGYSVEAIDFLLKPLTPFHFQEHFKKIYDRLDHSPQKNYTLKTSNGIRKILLDDLFFVESEGHYLHFHTKDKDYTILKSMKTVETELKAENFFRCNNGYLVNLKHVSAIEGNTVQVGHHELIVSRPRKKEFMAALTDYLANAGGSYD